MPRKKTEAPIWKAGHLPPYLNETFPFQGNTNLSTCINELETPADFFNFFFNDDLMNFLVDQSNLYALQVDINKPAGITRNEVDQFIGMVIYMSLVQLPSSRLYWNSTLGQEIIYGTMSCNRWETIKRFLHFNNNNDMKLAGEAGFDKLFKIRPVLDKIRNQLLLVPKEEHLVVDEQIIPTKCHHHLKQYNPAKPHKWGFKNFVLSGVSGFSYDFDIFAGAQSDTYPEGAPNLGVSGNVVSRLSATVPKGKNYKLFFDNWFNSPNLEVYLMKNGILALGTVRINRVPNSKMPTEKELKSQGRGSMVEKVAIIDGVQLGLVSWFDNKVVNILSSYVGSNPVTTKKRFSKKDKKYVEINSPKAVDVYNNYMGGVDLLDSLLGLYRIQLRSRKWYKKIFFHMIDMCVVNSWILWRRKSDQYMPLFDFKLLIAEHLCKAGKVKKRGRPAMTPTSSPCTSREGTPTTSKRRKHQEIALNSVREDHIGHFPTWKKQRQLCKNDCSFRSYTFCEKCNVFLCYNDKRNCFTNFHMK